MSVPGQPVSVDAAYRTGNVTIHDRSGERRVIRRPVLTDEAAAWRDAVTTFVRLAKPSKWTASGMIRITIGLFLCRDIDDDNTLKLIYDGIQAALGMNDRNFIHCVAYKEHGLPLKDAHVELAIDNDPSHIHLIDWPPRRMRSAAATP